MSLPASDNFAGTVLSANWTVDAGTFTVSSGIVTTTTTGDSLAHWNADSFPNDQYSQVTILSAFPLNSKQAGLIVRATDNNNFYVARAQAASGPTWTTELACIHGGTFVSFTTNATSWAVNDVMKLQVVGNVLTLYKNGTSVLSFTDTNNFRTSGSAGIYTGSSATTPTPGLGVWSGGSAGVLVGRNVYTSPASVSPFNASGNACSSGGLNNYTGVPGTATTAWLNVAATGTANTAKVCLYDSGGALVATSAAISVSSPGLKSGAISATITAQTYTVVVVCDTGSFTGTVQTSSSAFVDKQWTPAHFAYSAPPSTLPAADLNGVGQEFIVYLTSGGNAYNLTATNPAYSHVIEATTLVNLGSTHTYVLPAMAVIYDRLVGVSTDDQILNVSNVSFTRSVIDAQFLPHGGRLSVSGIIVNRLVGAAQFTYQQAGFTPVTICSYDYANYAAFRTQVQQLMDGDDVSTSSISTSIMDAIIATGERKLYRDVRSSTQDTALSLTVSGNSAPMPVDLIELRSVYVANGFPATYMPYEQLQAKLQRGTSYATSPYYYSSEGDNIVFYPPQPDGTTISGRYYKRFCSIVTEGLTGNTYFARFPDLWIYAALLESAPFIGESSRFPVWQQRYEEIAATVANFERRRYTRGSKLSVRVS